MLKISVATVCYNCKDTIEKTIISVLMQTYREIEYIIVDGASTDGTLDIVDKYIEDDRIVLISEPDKGLYDAMNKAVARATGDYIIYMNSGDVFASDDVFDKIKNYLYGNNDLGY